MFRNMNNREQVITKNIQDIQKRISDAASRAGKSKREITLLAVTKNVSVEDIRVAIRAGIRFLGENKVQEAKQKFSQIGPAVTWHMIGHLQTNKARTAAAIFDLVQSIDSEKVAEALSREAMRLDRHLDVLVEVNISEEENKFGISREKTEELVRLVRTKKNLRLRGLMSMAPFVPEPELTRPFFRDLSSLFEKCRPLAGEHWGILSMGMTHDFEVAIEEGANLVRVGTGIFHSRELRRSA